ncbi:MAG TPA: hypothetical protein ENI56_01675 [Candidatus Kaiserbacteria bacterium]|nr:hypothetical protein [Candidatus Kaiserbacteria bacterium]
MFTHVYFYIKNILLHPAIKSIALIALVGIVSFGAFTAVPAPTAHAFFNFRTGSGGTSINGCANTGNGYVSGSSNSLSNFFGFSTQGHCNGASGYAILILEIINGILVPIIFSIAFIVFIWGMFKYFIAGGANPEEQAKGWKLLMYGLIGFAVMISIWGLVNIILHTFNLQDTAPPYPYI